ncbi:hypothetical protein Syun_016496 [Stephania yunnanensis]|uniref:HMA domain-containing protein n=1 Tax=Stephania yunnanensis TaxID=152371 RepID=A0AAP0J5B2_9MAGN
MSQTVVLKVGMSCEGCVGAVKRVLSKMEGVEEFNVDIKEQKVTVKGNVQPEAVLQTVSRTGKRLSSGKMKHQKLQRQRWQKQKRQKQKRLK